MIDVIITEFERGWGQRIIDGKEFDSFTKAKEFKDKYNDTVQNTPDIYSVATMILCE